MGDGGGVGCLLDAFGFDETKEILAATTKLKDVDVLFGMAGIAG